MDASSGRFADLDALLADNFLSSFLGARSRPTTAPQSLGQPDAGAVDFKPGDRVQLQDLTQSSLSGAMGNVLRTEPQDARGVLVKLLGYDHRTIKVRSSKVRLIERATATAPAEQAMVPARERSPRRVADGRCVVCLDAPATFVSTKCMHLCVCEGCANELTDLGEPCPVCRSSEQAAHFRRLYVVA